MVEVRQREYAIGLRGTASSVLVTENICTCTGLVGVNQHSGAAFLCHLDTPVCVAGLALMERDLRPYGGLGAFSLSWVTGSPPWITWAMAYIPDITRRAIWRKLQSLSASQPSRTRFLGYPRTRIRCGISVDANSGLVSLDSYILPREPNKFRPRKAWSFELTKAPGSA